VDAALAALAAKALDLVPDGARVGLGTGHAAKAFLHALGGRVRTGLFLGTASLVLAGQEGHVEEMLKG
jgi:ribose 5-phosphate isomerase